MKELVIWVFWEEAGVKTWSSQCSCAKKEGAYIFSLRFVDITVNGAKMIPEEKWGGKMRVE